MIGLKVINYPSCKECEEIVWNCDQCMEHFEEGEDMICCEDKHYHKDCYDEFKKE